jgi:putative ABC transport system ATP-binding protein
MLFVTGPSGSGKTTLLSILGCVLRPTSGETKVLGQDISRLSDGRLARFRLENLGFVFQSHNLIASLTSLENARLPLLLSGYPVGQANARATADLERVGLAAKRDRLPRDLSGGQRQRVAIARAVSTRPALLLADEPTASLDATSGKEVMELLRDLTRELGITVIVVSHDARTYHFADRLVDMEDGRFVDPSLAVRRNP